MASPSSTSIGTQYHVRSISFPSRLHPNSTKIEIELNKLKTWKISSESSLNAETIRVGLVSLTDLYNLVDEIVQSPLTQQKGFLVEEALEESIGLLDSCGTIRELVFKMKENVQELQSALRRKGIDSSIGREINAYFCFRKKVKKDAAKGHRVLKQIESKIGSSFPLDIELDISVIIRMLREVSSITVAIFHSLFVFLVGPVSKIKFGGWSLISKLVMGRPGGSEKMVNEVGSVDFALCSVQGQIRNFDGKIDVQNAKKMLHALDESLGGLEALDCLYRRLVQTRVSLLNIIVH